MYVVCARELTKIKRSADRNTIHPGSSSSCAMASNCRVVKAMFPCSTICKSLSSIYTQFGFWFAFFIAYLDNAEPALKICWLIEDGEGDRRLSTAQFLRVHLCFVVCLYVFSYNYQSVIHVCPFCPPSYSSMLGLVYKIHFECMVAVVVGRVGHIVLYRLFISQVLAIHIKIV